MGEAEAQRIRAHKTAAPEKTLGVIPSGSIGPFVAWRNPDRGLAAYVSGPMGASRNLVTWAVGDGKLSEQKIALEVPVETSRLRVRELGLQGTSYVAMYTSLEGKGEALSAVGLAGDGRALGKSIQMATTTSLIAWFDVVPTTRGAVALWIEESGNGGDVLTLAIERDGTVAGVPARVARNVTAWQVTRDAMGAALAVVAKTGDKGDRVDLLRIDDGGQVREAIPVADKQATLGDIDVVKTARGYRVAWTDRASGELRVLGADIDTQSRKVEPRVLAEARGGATLVALAEAKHGSLLVWDERSRHDQKARTIHLSTLGQKGGRKDVALDTDAVEPQIIPSDTGWTVLTSVNGAPALAKTSPDLETRVNVSTDTSWGPANMAWAMTCFSASCRFLAAVGATDPRVAIVDFDPALTAANLANTARTPDGRELGAQNSIEVGEPIATIAATQVGENTLVAVLTQSVEDPRKPKSASKVLVYTIDAKGALLGSVQTITDRALPVGGVAIASFSIGTGPKPLEGAVITWVARENGDPEVHMASVDATGKRTKHAQLTQTKGDASDVALAPVEGGFVLAWVDARNGQPEVYATKITHDLKRIAREERITQTKSSKSDLSLLATPAGVVVAWSDTRDAEGEGFGDIFLAKIGARDARRVGSEARVLATAAHSRTPNLFTHGENVAIAWIEDGTSIDTSTAMFGTFTRALERGDAPARVPLAQPGRPQSLSFASNDGKLTGFLARSTPNGAALDVIEGAPNALRATMLSTEKGRPTPDTTVVLTPKAVFFAEEGATAAEHRLHHGHL